MVAIVLALLFVFITAIAMIVRGSDLDDKVRLPWEKKETKAEKKARLDEEAKQNYFSGGTK